MSDTAITLYPDSQSGPYKYVKGHHRATALHAVFMHSPGLIIPWNSFDFVLHNEAVHCQMMLHSAR